MSAPNRTASKRPHASTLGPARAGSFRVAAWEPARVGVPPMVQTAPEAPTPWPRELKKAGGAAQGPAGRGPATHAAREACAEHVSVDTCDPCEGQRAVLVSSGSKRDGLDRWERLHGRIFDDGGACDVELWCTGLEDA